MKFKNLQKSLIKLLFVFTFALTCVIFTSHKAFASVVKGFNFEAGDILVTSSTSSGGLLGHVGIVLPDGNSVVHIAGQGCKSTKISLNEWLDTYSKTKVVRANSSSDPIHSMAPLGAAYAGKNFFVEGEGRNIPYMITPGIEGRKHMYCSKLVWQCYNAAGLVYEILKYDAVSDGMSYVVPLTISPYDFINANALQHNGFRIVKSFNW